MAPSPRISLFLRTLGQGFDTESWHGTTLRGSPRRPDPAPQAAARPPLDPFRFIAR
jgi:hypothetical protein